MKRIVSLGKWMAVLSLGAFLFAGCVGPSSDDSAVTPQASELSGKFVYKFNVDIPNGTLDIEPVTMGTAVSTTHFGGVIEVSTSGCQAPGTIPNTCNVTIKNKTPLLNLTQLRTWEYASTSGTATNSSDFTGSTLVANSTQAIADSGQCLLENGAWVKISGANQLDKGCPTYTYGSPLKQTPLQILHPDCGTLTTTWTFGTDSTSYNFYTALVDIAASSTTALATFRPEDMLADSRYSGANFSTFVVKPYYLDATNCVGGCKAAYATYTCVGNGNASNYGYHLGAPQCSTPVDFNAPVANGTFFAVSAGIEYADRLEGQAGRVARNNFSGAAYCFEYPFTNFITYSWDSTVLALQTVSAVTGAGTAVDVQADNWLTSSTSSALGPGSDATVMGRYVNENNRYNAGASQPNLGANFFQVKRNAGAALFGVQTAPATVSCRASIWNDTAVAWSIANMWNTSAAWFGMGTMAGTPCALTNDGVDAAVDGWHSLVYFQVIGASGTGSRIKIENTADLMQIGLNSSNCTTQGGPAGAGDDVKGSAWCNPCTAGSTNLACGGATQGGTISCVGKDYNTPGQYVYSNQELSNDNMPGGPNSNKGKGYNAQNAHICVQ